MAVTTWYSVMRQVITQYKDRFLIQQPPGSQVTLDGLSTTVDHDTPPGSIIDATNNRVNEQLTCDSKHVMQCLWPRGKCSCAERKKNILPDSDMLLTKSRYIDL